MNRSSRLVSTTRSAITVAGKEKLSPAFSGWKRTTPYIQRSLATSSSGVFCRTRILFHQKNNNTRIMSAAFSSSSSSSSQQQQEQSRSSSRLLSMATADLYDEFLDDCRVVGTNHTTNSGSGNGACCCCCSWRHYGSTTHFAGPVVTVSCWNDNSRIKELASDTSSQGVRRVMVVDAGGTSSPCAVLGDLIAQAAVNQGKWAGIIIQGLVRDVAVLRTIRNTTPNQNASLGIMALGSTPRKSVRRGQGQVNIPIFIGGSGGGNHNDDNNDNNGAVQVNPGDYVVADEDGMIFLRADQVEKPDSLR